MDGFSEVMKVLVPVCSHLFAGELQQDGWGPFPPAAAPTRLALTLCCLDGRAQTGLSRLQLVPGLVWDLVWSRAGPLKAEHVFCSQVSSKLSFNQTSLCF